MKSFLANTSEVKIVRISFIIFAFLSIFLALNKNSKSQPFTYQSEIWSDKAGYYIYLPATFHYGFEAENYPDSIIEKTGLGFKFKNDYIVTKYTYGVALLQSPFYFIANIFANKSELKSFSRLHHKMINVASGFYLALGLMFLYFFLRNYFEPLPVIITLLALYTASNLYYFSTDESGMAHVYSFFLFSTLLFLLKKVAFFTKKSILYSLFIGLVIGLIVLIRPTNAVFILVVFFIDVRNLNGFAKRVKLLILNPYFWLCVFISVLVFVPQLLYWYLISGKFIYYSYEGEGFIWSSPKILKTLFSPLNGLVIYTPLVVFIWIGIFLMIKNRVSNGVLLFLTFMTITYIFSCWWDWAFGCSLGARSYVEYYSFLSLGLCFFFKKVISSSKYIKVSVTLIMGLFIYYNLKFSYNYDGCFNGHRNWDWERYFEVISPLF